MTKNISTNIGSSYSCEMPRVINTQAFLEEGYTVYEHSIRVTEIDDLLAAMSRDGAEVVDLRAYNHRLTIKTDDVVVIHNEDSTGITLMAKSRSALNSFTARYFEFLEAYDDDSASIYYYYMTKGEVKHQFMSMQLSKLPRVVPELYPDVDANELARAFNVAEEPILLLYGIPGVGKTTYLKYLLQTREYRRVAYIKDMKVMMASDFWSTVAASHYDLLIFDDLDFALGPRAEGDHSGFVSNLLSYSDGIFNYNRSKIVITTNQAINKIDNALVRPGRCFDFLVLNPLTNEQARSIWIDVLGADSRDFDNLYSGSRHVTQASLMSDYQRLMVSTRERRYIRGEDRFYTVEQKLGETGVSVFDSHHRMGFPENAGF